MHCCAFGSDMAVAGPISHSVYGMGVVKASPPDFGALSKPTATVDVGRLQTELRALHGRLEMLEVVALAAAEEKEKEPELDKDLGSSGVKVAVGARGGGDGTPRTVDESSKDGEMELGGEMSGRCVGVGVCSNRRTKQQTARSNGLRRLGTVLAKLAGKPRCLRSMCFRVWCCGTAVVLWLSGFEVASNRTYMILPLRRGCGMIDGQGNLLVHTICMSNM